MYQIKADFFVLYLFRIDVEEHFESLVRYDVETLPHFRLVFYDEFILQVTEETVERGRVSAV